jgi:hypothetical protein
LFARELARFGHPRAVRTKACGEEEHQFLLLFLWQRISRSFDFRKVAQGARLKLMLCIHGPGNLNRVRDYDNVTGRDQKTSFPTVR